MPLLTTGAGKFAAAGGGASYTGPGDVQGSATSFWGLRAYSQAKATATVSALDLLDQSGANPITIAVKTNGDLDIASISAWVTAHSVTTIRVPKLYDQVGTNHVTQAVLSSMPTLVLSAIGTGPAVNMTFLNNAGALTPLDATITSVAQPFTLAGVGAATEAGTNGSMMGTSTTGSVALGFADEATPRRLYAFSGVNSFSTATVATGSPATVIGFYNGASSHNTYNGTTATTSPGTNALGTNFSLGRWPGNDGFVGTFVEAGLWGSVGWTTTISGNLSSNQRAYWGF